MSCSQLGCMNDEVGYSFPAEVRATVEAFSLSLITVGDGQKFEFTCTSPPFSPHAANLTVRLSGNLTRPSGLSAPA